MIPTLLTKIILGINYFSLTVKSIPFIRLKRCWDFARIAPAGDPSSDVDFIKTVNKNRLST